MKINKSHCAMVFPGQGSQHVGMGVALADMYPTAKSVFQEVDEALGESLSRLMREGPEEELRLTGNAQPALMAVSIAALRVIEGKTDNKITDLVDCVAGHSLGEYSALVAAESISLSDCARLLKLRGQSMQSAVPVGAGAMAALIGADIKVANEIVDSVRGHGVCDIANDNAPGQVVISGTTDTIKKAVELSQKKGVKKAMMLPVSAPFHCSLMEPAAKVMRDALETIQIKPPKVPIVTNVSASAIADSAYDIKRTLVEQVTAMVRWRESIVWMANSGIISIAEVGAGKILSGLIRRIDKNLETISLGEPEDIVVYINSLSS
ncbi:MAG: [acyl-carrier-protein] S-malonyltransferase [Rhodospirillaceae bacterium]|nr:[acyl-carrier-protein] S-malonyltransferase [Rhodospirillaceae bacterium]|tara:strand:- start:130 stop:1095 length:966 start_codon:yes stop_codon:yes gene_type:complete